MSDFSAGESGRETELVLDGSLTIENASEIRKKLISTLIRKIRLWSALTRMCIAGGLVFIAASLLDHVLPQISANLSRSGIRVRCISLLQLKSAYNRRKGCVHDGICLWAGGRHD